MVEYIRNLLKNGKINECIDILTKKLSNDNQLNFFLVVKNRYNSLLKDKSLFSDKNFEIELNKISVALFEIVCNMKNTNKKVFISYNHKDYEIVEKIVAVLKDNEIDIIIDKKDMTAGENINSFIENSINESDITLSIISNNSLLSSWVGIETINTFYSENFNNKQFIACYLDSDFFDNKYRLIATKSIDSKIKEIDDLILEYKELKIDTDDLNFEKTRLFRLRNSLGIILDRLRNSLCIDIKESVFEPNMQKILNVIKKPTEN